jgi:anti-sigma B factor antagonist
VRLGKIPGGRFVHYGCNAKAISRWNTVLPVFASLFADISSEKETVLGTYQGLPPEMKRILLDLSKVEYINSSAIALIIQVLMQARNTGQSVQTFGVSDHFRRVFTLVGMTKYTDLHADELSACAAFTE